MNMLDLLEEHNVDYKLHGQHEHTTPDFIQVDCPWCSKGWNHFRLGIAKRGFVTVCWTCGKVPFTQTISEITGLDYPKLIPLLGRMTQQKWDETVKVSGKLILPNNLTDLQQPHLNYLEKRGFDPVEISNNWQVKAIGISPKLGWRIFIPVISRSKIVSWTTRSISNKHERRYISAKPTQESQPLKSLLYGQDHVKHKVVVCEGPTDVWAIGFGAVCTFGLSVTQQQVIKISKYPVRTILFDSEPAAQKKAKKLCQQLRSLPGETYQVELETGKDAASAEVQEIEQLRKRFLE